MSTEVIALDPVRRHLFLPILMDTSLLRNHTELPVNLVRI